MANNQHGRFDAADYKKIDFSNNRYITLSTEIIEVTLDDQSKSL